MQQNCNSIYSPKTLDEQILCSCDCIRMPACQEPSRVRHQARITYQSELSWLNLEHVDSVKKACWQESQKLKIERQKARPESQGSIRGLICQDNTQHTSWARHAETMPGTTRGFQVFFGAQRLPVCIDPDSSTS